MTKTHQETGKAKPRRTVRLLVACLLLFALAAMASVLLRSGGKSEPPRSDTDVPLGVEQAVIVRYGGPLLQAKPYRPGASLNLRVADQQPKGDLRIYDIRYVVSLPGTFDLTDYLTSADGRPIDDLPPFAVRGLTSLTKDIETRIREIENVGVDIWHWYYESLVGLGVFWVAWLAGLVFIGRPKRVPQPPAAPPLPSRSEQIERFLAAMSQRELTTEEKACLEALLLSHWRHRLDLADQRMAGSCRRIAASRQTGPVYRKLQDWLHNPRSPITPEEFVIAYTQHTTPK